MFTTLLIWEKRCRIQLRLPRTWYKIPKPSFTITAPMLAPNMRHRPFPHMLPMATLSSTAVSKFLIPKCRNHHHCCTGTSKNHNLHYAWHLQGSWTDDARQAVNSVYSPRVAVLESRKAHVCGKGTVRRHNASLWARDKATEWCDTLFVSPILTTNLHFPLVTSSCC